MNATTTTISSTSTNESNKKLRGERRVVATREAFVTDLFDVLLDAINKKREQARMSHEFIKADNSMLEALFP